MGKLTTKPKLGPVKGPKARGRKAVAPPPGTPAPARLTTSVARQSLPQLVAQVRNGRRFMLTRHNKPVAALVSVEDLEFLRAAEDHHDARLARLALDDVAEHGTVPWDQVKAELGL